MEELKELAEIVSPDERNKYRAVTLESLHAIASSITLGSTVPEVVRNQFEISRNAFVYSWFFYPFQPAAEMYSVLAIELALNLRLKTHRPELFQQKRPPTLTDLLTVAIKDRLLVDCGFDVQVPPDSAVTIDQNNPQAPIAPADQQYCYILLHALPKLRNGLAHGEYVLVPGVSHSLARAAELINQLYPDSPQA